MTESVEFGAAEEIGDANTDSLAMKPRRRRWTAAVVIGAAVAVLAGGAAYAVTTLSGGGVQPQDVLPATVIGYARLDFDPAANQKIALLRFTGRFDATKTEGNDPRAALVKMLGAGDGVDFARDVQPWLGDRMGVAILPPDPGDTTPETVFALKVGDEDEARAGIAKLRGGRGNGVAFLDGYAIVAETQARADEVAAEADDRPLAGDAAFKSDLAALGEPGVLSFWADAGKAAAILKKAMPPTGANAYVLDAFAHARVAGALRFTGDYAEIAGVTRGITQPPMRYGPVHIGELPAATALAVSFSGMDNVIAAGWRDSADASLPSSARATIDMMKKDYGFTLPDDLVAMFGGNLTLAVELDGTAPPKTGLVKRSYSAKASEVQERIMALYADMGVPLSYATFADGHVFATSQEYANTLGHTTELGRDPVFREAVADVATATYAAYVDLDKLEPRYLPSVPERERADVARLRAIGFSAQHNQDLGAFHLRVVLN